MGQVWVLISISICRSGLCSFPPHFSEPELCSFLIRSSLPGYTNIQVNYDFCLLSVFSPLTFYLLGVSSYFVSPKHIYITARNEAKMSLTYLEVAALHLVAKMTEN